MAKTTPEPGERWRFKPNRGSGIFQITRVKGERVHLKDVWGYRRPKTVSLRTLRSDYEPDR